MSIPGDRMQPDPRRRSAPAVSKSDAESEQISPSLVNSLGIALASLALLLIYLSASVWPSGFELGAKGNTPRMVCLLWADSICREFSADVQILLMVIVVGALGSFIHTATSFADFVGNRRLSRSWIWWYLLKPFIGMALAVIVYLVMRGGFLGSSASADTLNIYGIAGVSAMAGMFSKQATDKLSEIFDTVFRTAKGSGDEKRKDGLGHTGPSLTDLTPSSLALGTSDLAIQVRGARFVDGSVVRIGGAERDTEYKSDSLLVAKMSPNDVAKAGQLELTVFNPGPGGGQSSPLSLRVDSAAVGGAGGEHEDGCDVEIAHATPDEALPPATGGVSKT